jgi:tetratricopeptide (TPR) repeat protein
VHGALLLILGVTFAVYAPVLRHGFVEWDDPYYVTENVHVQTGLTASGAVWALTSRDLANWHPVTWLSHMADVSFFGMDPHGHHLTSVILHLLNTLLLFVAFQRMTQSPWRSLAVAALFALHPLHVESVAWVSERKDVLSTTFWLLALWAYARFAEQPGTLRYSLVALIFGLGLLAKPMLVSLPLTLLILDGWPLARVAESRFSAWWPRVLEKLPLVAMSLAVSVSAWVAQRSAGAITDTPLATKLANVVLGYVGYLKLTIWPAKLAAFYPYELQPALGEVAVAAAILVAVSVGVWFGRRRPYLLAGWLWYVITLAPVSGLVRIGQQQMADRYSYVPLVGVFVALVWGARRRCGASSSRTCRPRATALVGVLIIAALALGARRQVGTWGNGITLWEHAIEVGGNSTVSQNNLGVALQKAGRLDEAAAHYAEAVRLEPKHAKALANLANVRFTQGRYAEAIVSYEEALRLDPGNAQARRDLAKAHFNLANSAWREGRLDQALLEYREAIRWAPEDASYHRALGMAMVQKGQSRDAVYAFEESLRLDPENPTTHDALAVALFDCGDYEGAWREVQACRQRGGTPTASLVQALSQKMPEPR